MKPTTFNDIFPWRAGHLHDVEVKRAYYPPGEESFAAKLVKATKARAETVKQHKERVERGRARYKPFKRRPRSKSD
jgi:hypothetical protein